MSENRIFVMDTAGVLATCGVALADGEAAREIAKLLPAPAEAVNMSEGNAPEHANPPDAKVRGSSHS